MPESTSTSRANLTPIRFTDGLMREKTTGAYIHKDTGEVYAKTFSEIDKCKHLHTAGYNVSNKANRHGYFKLTDPRGREKKLLYRDSTNTRLFEKTYKKARIRIIQNDAGDSFQRLARDTTKTHPGRALAVIAALLAIPILGGA